MTEFGHRPIFVDPDSINRLHAEIEEVLASVDESGLTAEERTLVDDYLHHLSETAPTYFTVMQLEDPAIILEIAKSMKFPRRA